MNYGDPDRPILALEKAKYLESRGWILEWRRDGKGANWVPGAMRSSPVEDAEEEWRLELLRRQVAGGDAGGRQGEQASPLADPVNHPPHYATGGVECIDALRAALTPEEFCGFLKGNVIKYLWRERRKGRPQEDRRKAEWYLARLVELGTETKGASQ